MRSNNQTTAKNHRKHLISRVIAVLIIACLSSAYFATVSSADPKTETSSYIVPQQGEVMESVYARLGEPKEKHPPVGTPPIERWVYKKFTVYFENDRVIHSVIHKGKLPAR